MAPDIKIVSKLDAISLVAGRLDIALDIGYGARDFRI
jgi:hypothetical protein